MALCIGFVDIMQKGKKGEIKWDSFGGSFIQKESQKFEGFVGEFSLFFLRVTVYS